MPVVDYYRKRDLVEEVRLSCLHYADETDEHRSTPLRRPMRCMRTSKRSWTSASGPAAPTLLLVPRRSLTLRPRPLLLRRPSKGTERHRLCHRCRVVRLRRSWVLLSERVTEHGDRSRSSGFKNREGRVIRVTPVEYVTHTCIPILAHCTGAPRYS